MWICSFVLLQCVNTTKAMKCYKTDHFQVLSFRTGYGRIPSVLARLTWFELMDAGFLPRGGGAGAPP